VSKKNKTAKKKSKLEDSVKGRCVFHGVKAALEPFGVELTPEDLDKGAATALAKRSAASFGPRRDSEGRQHSWRLEDVCSPGQQWSFDCVLESLKIKGEEIGRYIKMARVRDTSVLTAPASKGRFVVDGVLNRKVWGHPVTGELPEQLSRNPGDWHHVIVVDRDANVILDKNTDGGSSSFSAAGLHAALLSYLEEVWRVYQITVTP
jgi:hypothetical protein